MSLHKVFRNKFEAPNIEIAGWFARHMFKSVFQMQNKLKDVDCIIEVHDARIPFSGRNPSFRMMLTAIKPHLLIFNKCDLADPGYFSTVEKYYKERGVDKVIFTDCKSDKKYGINKIIPSVDELVRTSNRFNREQAGEFNVMIIGVPNVGKSTIINKLRNKYFFKGAATKVGALPGVTQSVLEKIKISQDPQIFLLDTPGISAPRLPDLETGLRLGLCAILRDTSVGEHLLADYLLYWLNKHCNFTYVEHLGLDEPCDNVSEVLLKSAVKNEKKIMTTINGRKALMPNLQWSAFKFIKAFQNGEYGRVLLDDDRF